MATLAPNIPDAPASAAGTEERFFFKLACAMALVMVAGFSTQYLMGRSSFAAPLRVHAHAVIFFGWVMLFVVQANAAMRRDFAMHRTLGKVAAVWIPMMIAAAVVVIVAMTRAGNAPFFFFPQEFLIANPAGMLCFAGLTAWAVANRRRSDWHMRLHVCAFAAISGPGFGRLLPMPLLTPYAFEAAVLAGLIFPVAGMVRDQRVHGKAHPAWWRGMAVIVATLLVANVIARSPLGDALYAAVVAGTPGASVPGLALPPPPV
jgi:hypothetical protein